MATADLKRELVFGVGIFVGVLLFALGLAFVILGLSTGVQNVGPEGYLTNTQETALLVIGGVLSLVGFLARLFRFEVFETRQRLVKVLGTAAVVVGSWMVLFSVAAESTPGGPYLSSPREKVALMVIAYALLFGGYGIVQRVRRAVGV